VMAFKTYRGDVPMSPKIIPSAINNPATLTRLCDDIYHLILRNKSSMGIQPKRKPAKILIKSLHGFKAPYLH
jgi:hypothetical protein